MIEGETTWGEIDLNWGDIMQLLRERLPVQDEIGLNRAGVMVKTQRPMIEDIVCARSARDDILIAYLAAAGIIVRLSTYREPRSIDTDAHDRIGFGQGGEGHK